MGRYGRTGDVAHTHRIMEPEDQTFGEWTAPGEVPETLIAILANSAVHLPGSAAPRWRKSRARIRERTARRNRSHAVSCRSPRDPARAFAKYRSAALDAILERAEFVRTSPTMSIAPVRAELREPPHPALNRPFGPPWEIQKVW